MSRKPEDIIADALRLPVKERAAFVSRLLDSLDDLSEKEEKENDQFWAEEAERRYADYEAGKIEAVAAEEVFARLRSRSK